MERMPQRSQPPVAAHEAAEAHEATDAAHEAAAALRSPSADVTRQLVANHRRFLAFLEPRVESRAVAEEILQAAFVRSLEKADELRDEERAVAWFYRLLRNAVVDHYRRRASYARALERSAAEAAAQPPSATSPPSASSSFLPSSSSVDGLPAGLGDAALEAEVCQCMHALLPTLQPQYAELLERVELGGQKLGEVAAELGITAGNAAVRLHRARRALKRQLEKSCGSCATHGCLQCTCERRDGDPC